MNSIRNTIVRNFRRSFVSGLLLLVPIALTYVIISFLFDLVDGVLRPWMQWILERFGIDWSLPGPGIIAAVVLVYVIGAIAALRLGRASVDWVRASLLKVPFIGTIYSANRQLVESFSGTSTTGFKRVVLVQFPKAGTWSLGFLTGLTDAEDLERLIMTYVPTAPLPSSGFVVMLRPQEVLDTDLTVPDAMQLIFSGGIISPRNIKTRKIDVEEVERQIQLMDRPSRVITSAVGQSVLTKVIKATRLSVRRLRESSSNAVRTVGKADHGSSSIARDAMIGAMHAADGLGARSVAHVRKTTIGVVLGVRDATGVTTRILHDVVAGAVRGGSGRRIEDVSLRGAAEGTIQVAESIGIPLEQAIIQVTRATVETLRESEKELINGSKQTLKGVVAASNSCTEDVLEAARLVAYELLSNAAEGDFSGLGSLVTALLEAADEVSFELDLESNALTRAVADGIQRAAEEMSECAREAVKAAVDSALNDSREDTEDGSCEVTGQQRSN